MITKNTIISGVVCGLICVAFMWSYMSFGEGDYMTRSGSTNTSTEQSMKHMMGNSMMSNNTNMMSNGTSSMQDMMMNMNAGLQGKSGKDLEKAFLTEMIPHHEGAVTMAQAVLADKTITNQDVIKLANDIVTSQQKEISEMKLWLTKY